MQIRDVLKRLHENGWHEVRRRGSHRVLKHDHKPGIVVVPGHLSHDVAPGTLKNIWQQAQLEETR